MGIEFQVNGERVVFLGSGKADIVTPEGYGVTATTKDIWEEILTKFKDYAPIKNGVVFARENKTAGEKESEGMKGEHTNFDRLDYDNPQISGLGMDIEPIDDLKTAKSKGKQR